MTCRHAPGYHDNDYRSSYSPPPVVKPLVETPDATKFEIVDAHRTGKNIVLKVRYPNCIRCSYEGNKVMVFLNVTETDILKWREIDPHFRDPKKLVKTSEAPSPAARFPASGDGWAEAISFAKRKE